MVISALRLGIITELSQLEWESEIPGTTHACILLTKASINDEIPGGMHGHCRPYCMTL